MPLLQLPPELLTQIFDDVGSSYFRSDISRLILCKQLSKFTKAACYQDIDMTQRTLERFRSSTRAESSQPLVKNCFKSLDLDLRGFEDWIASIPLNHLQGLSSPGNLSILGNTVHASTFRAQWVTRLNTDLMYLATLIERSPRLHQLRIQATSEPKPLSYLSDRRDYLFQSSIRALLAAGNLSSLDLDLCAAQLLPHQSLAFPGDPHICTHIAALLPTLRHLRLRMRSICADALRLRQPSTDLRLQVLLINLSLPNESSWEPVAIHAECCGSPQVDFLQLKADSETQAQVLVANMATPKMVRVLTHEVSSTDLVAFDVLTGKNIKLSKGAAWDDDGEVVEDGEVIEE